MTDEDWADLAGELCGEYPRLPVRAVLGTLNNLIVSIEVSNVDDVSVVVELARYELDALDAPVVRSLRASIPNQDERRHER